MNPFICGAVSCGEELGWDDELGGGLERDRVEGLRWDGDWNLDSGSAPAPPRRHISRTHHAMEFTPFVALWPTVGTFVFTRAELAEVFGRLGEGVGEEMYFDSA